MTKLIFSGIVQGVGFRPTVYRVATMLDRHGYVLNKGAEVEVAIDGDVDEFLTVLHKHLPSIASIDSVERIPDDKKYDEFQILHSNTGQRHSRIPADVAVCDHCIQEMNNPKNRRYRYPFTNCTVCGARFSLIDDVPYDRERTAMQPFELCEQCQLEYEKPSNRRYHAQTISCPQCGPAMSVYNSEGEPIDVENPIQQFAHFLENGAIGVMKSWGGMHLCCTLDQIPRFRTWYHRPQKPFAIMARDIQAVKKYGKINTFEEKLLTSSQRPVVTLEKICDEHMISPGLNTIGVFLPYTGVHHRLFANIDMDALLMTSANVPGEPMLINNDDAFALQADYYLFHNRAILHRIDDSVIKPWRHHTFFLRKSRGYVPDPLPVPHTKTIACVGAGEHICGALSHKKIVYMTQYIGNSKYYSVVEFLQESLEHLMKLTMSKPMLDAVAADLHPGYGSRTVAEQFTQTYDVPLIEVQHHWAHAAALLVDNQVDESMVLSIDGLGYGADETLWGGEILHSKFDSYKRVGHLQPFPLLGGDQATHDPRRLVFALLDGDEQTGYFIDEEIHVLQQLQKTSPISSSLGRFLDAVSCYLGICMKRTYDGEPAMKLEPYLAKGTQTYDFQCSLNHGVINSIDLFQQLSSYQTSKLSEKEKADLAYSVVKTLMDAMIDVACDAADTKNISTIGLTGGVSYNIPICDMVQQRVNNRGLSLLVHNTIPNGDGCVAVGQNAIAGVKLSA